MSKDIAIAILGAAVSLAGLLLIFCGFLFTQLAALDPLTPDPTLNSYRGAARWGLFPFAICLAEAGVALWWLLSPSDLLFTTLWVGFVALLAGTALYGIVATLRFL